MVFAGILLSHCFQAYPRDKRPPHSRSQQQSQLFLSIHSRIFFCFESFIYEEARRENVVSILVDLESCSQKQNKFVKYSGIKLIIFDSSSIFFYLELNKKC
jgi:hypothetical protein